MENDISSIVKGISLVTKKSKAGNDYFVLRVTFNSGYTVDNFVNQDQLFILNSMLSQSKAH